MQKRARKPRARQIQRISAARPAGAVIWQQMAWNMLILYLHDICAAFVGIRTIFHGPMGFYH
jgi:hypothetical protein